jgi:hypothetical protein
MNVQLLASRPTRLLRLFFICGFFSSHPLFAQKVKILINHPGYEPHDTWYLLAISMKN